MKNAIILLSVFWRNVNNSSAKNPECIPFEDKRHEDPSGLYAEEGQHSVYRL